MCIMQEAVSLNNLILTRSKLRTTFVSHVYIAMHWGNDYVIIRGSCVIIDLMASAIWLANPSLLMIFFLMVPGDSGLISSKRWSSSFISAIC